MRALAPAGTLLFGLLTAAGGFAQTAAPVPPVTYPKTQPSPPPAGPAPAPEGPPGYYVEQGPPPPAETPAGSAPPGVAPPAVGPVYEPPPPAPNVVVFEPPPPPLPRHVAPRTALWLGARVGWLVPFGSAYALGVADPYGNVYLTSVPFSDFLRSGPAFEIDAGVRLGRHYNLFGLYQRTQLRSGTAERNLHGGQNGGDSDYFAGGLRASSDADGIGLLTEITLGYRQARAKWEDGTELRMTGGAFEGRIGLGADLRLNEVFSLSPMIELGVGSFDRIRVVEPGGHGYDLMGAYDAPGSHGWWMFSIGGFVDLFGTD